jgi:hypothetical protein
MAPAPRGSDRPGDRARCRPRRRPAWPPTGRSHTRRRLSSSGRNRAESRKKPVHRVVVDPSPHASEAAFASALLPCVRKGGRSSAWSLKQIAECTGALYTPSLFPPAGVDKVLTTATPPESRASSPHAVPPGPGTGFVPPPDPPAFDRVGGSSFATIGTDQQPTSFCRAVVVCPPSIIRPLRFVALDRTRDSCEKDDTVGSNRAAALACWVTEAGSVVRCGPVG